MTAVLYGWGLEFQAVNETPLDRLRCDGCRRWTRVWLTQGLYPDADADAVSRKFCPWCAKKHRGVE